MKLTAQQLEQFEREGYLFFPEMFKINGKMAFEGDVWQWHQDYGTWKNDDLMPAIHRASRLRAA